MKAIDLLYMIGNAEESIIEEAKKQAEANKQKRQIKPRWIIWPAAAACLCLIAVGTINTMLRFDYFMAGCGAMPGTIVNDAYYFNVQHSGAWRNSNGRSEKILSAYWEDGWLVNESGLYYKCGKSLFRMDPETHVREKIYSASDGTHIGFDLTGDGNVIVTVYDKHAKEAYQVLINGMTGEMIETLTEKTPYRHLEQLYTKLNYQVGDRHIVLIPTGDNTEEIEGETAEGTAGDDLSEVTTADGLSAGTSGEERYMPYENGAPLLPEGSWVSPYGTEISADVISFWVSKDNESPDSEKLLLFSDGYTLVIPAEFNYSGVIGHILLYVNNVNPENYGSNGSGIWCYDPEKGEKWQLAIDAECEFYEFENDDTMLYSCVPWNHDQTAWKIVYEEGSLEEGSREGARPVSLELIDRNIAEYKSE